MRWENKCVEAQALGGKYGTVRNTVVISVISVTMILMAAKIRIDRYGNRIGLLESRGKD